MMIRSIEGFYKNNFKKWEKKDRFGYKNFLIFLYIKIMREVKR